MKILLLGKNGQVGWELQRSLSLLGEVLACDFDSEGPLKADFSQPEALAELVAHVQPQVIVNAAAHTAVDKAESEPELARCLNATAPAASRRAAAGRTPGCCRLSTWARLLLQHSLHCCLGCDSRGGRVKGMARGPAPTFLARLPPAAPSLTGQVAAGGCAAQVPGQGD